MKRILCLMVALLCLSGALTGCGSGEGEGGTANKTANGTANVTTEREPMPTYEKLGVNNSIATSDGRYIYYTYIVEDKNEAALYRCDMDFSNHKELNEKTRKKFYNLFIDEGYMYMSAGKSAERVDIATGPDYFKGKDGAIALEPVFDDEAKKEILGVSYLVADDEYIYFESSGICRVKKDGTGFEQIASGEDFINFYDLKYYDGKLYAYCGDDQKLYRMNTDGSEVAEVCKMMESFVIYEGNAYYIFSGSNHAQELTKTNLETGETETLATLGEGWVSADLKNAMDGKIYYVYDDENDSYTLRTYDIASGATTVLCDLGGKVEKLDIVGDYVFYEQDETLLKVCIDGTNQEQLEK